MKKILAILLAVLINIVHVTLHGTPHYSVVREITDTGNVQPENLTDEEMKTVKEQ